MDRLIPQYDGRHAEICLWIYFYMEADDILIIGKYWENEGNRDTAQEMLWSDQSRRCVSLGTIHHTLCPIQLSQETYSKEILEKSGMADSRPYTTVFTVAPTSIKDELLYLEFTHQFKAVTSALLYSYRCITPDVSCPVIMSNLLPIEKNVYCDIWKIL